MYNVIARHARRRDFHCTGFAKVMLHLLIFRVIRAWCRFSGGSRISERGWGDFGNPTRTEVVLAFYAFVNKDVGRILAVYRLNCFNK